MKTKLRRFSRQILSVMLAIVMVVSCFVAGQIVTTNAATYYMLCSYNVQDPSSWSESNYASSSSYTFSLTPQNFGKTSWEMSKNYYIGLSSSTKVANMSCQSGTVNVSRSGSISGAYPQQRGNYRFAMFSLSSTSISTVNVTVTVNGTTANYAISTSAGSGSCSTGEKYVVTGDKALTNTTGWQNTWDGATTRNQLNYDTTEKAYKVEYTNIDKNTDGFNFRIVKADINDWSQDNGYDQTTFIDSESISTHSKGGDNNIKLTLSQKANITIVFDDSKNDTSRIIVTITPAVSTVSTAVTPANSGTATVNNASSVSNIAYGGSVSLKATAAQYYHFSKWTSTNGNLEFASNTSASTNATVKGSDTATANFEKDSYTVSKGTGEGYTITAPASNTSKPWGSTVTVTAEADSTHTVEYLYYKVNNSGSEIKICDGASGTLTVPKSNVTVYAKVHEKTSNTITYGVCTGQSGYGYVSVGEYHNSATNIKHTIDSGSNVLEGTKVNFCARPAVGYEFVGWYNTSASTGGTLLNANQDYTVTSPSGNYYARFKAGSDPAKASSGVRLLFSSTYSNYYIHAWDITGYTTPVWNTKKLTDFCTGTITNGKGTKYYYYDTTDTNFSLILISNHDNANGNKTGDLAITSAGTYTVTYTKDGKTSTCVKAYTEQKSGATTAYFPIKYYVTNPDKAGTETYAPAFGEKGKSVTIKHTPADTANMKVNRTTTGFTSNYTDDKTTSASSSRTMPSSYAETKFTATFIEKDYYKVTYSAGKGGTITAKAGDTPITSGTMVQEGKNVTFTATPSSGYSIKGWTGDCTGTSTTRTITSISKDSTARVYFTTNKGTANTNTYFGWTNNSTGDNVYPGSWSNFTSTYTRDGHVYAYIDSVTANNYYFISAYGSKVTSSSTAQDKCQKQYYRTAADTDGDVWANTDFSTYITEIGRYHWGENNDKCWDGRCNYVRFKVNSDVKALIIDLGPDDGDGHAQTHLGDSNHNFAENNYRIIPIFNTNISKVSVYAKDGSFRGSNNYDYLPGIADTVITTDTNVTNRTQHDEFETAVAAKGKSITVTTTIDANHRSTFYVKGFSVNGVTPELYEWKSNGVYSMTYNIPEDYDYDYLEITPIYSNKSSNNVLFYIENYDEKFQDTGWGNTLAVYPYYQNNSGSYVATKHNAFGGYPGQPVINYGGRRFIEIPTSYTTLAVDETTENCLIKGVTLSNDYFDIVHRDFCREVDDHLQTYDYDDFYKIYKETSDGKEVNHSGNDGRDKVADQITFAFKYRTSTNNFADSGSTVAYSNTGKTVHAPYSSFTLAEKDSKFKNGWEQLLDYHDRPVDLFGKQLTTAQQTEEPLLVVSDDYAINYVGRYATTWTVYKKGTTSYTKIAEIAPSALIVTSATRLADGNPYPAVADEAGKPTQPKLSTYADEYNDLKAYANKPVLITYESAIQNNSSYEKYWSMKNGSSEVATRSDGRWFYSYEGEKINANLKIEYRDSDTTDEYVTDSFKSGTNQGTVTGAAVQFTNKASDADGPYALEGLHDTEDYDGEVLSNFNHYYKFAATEGSGYIFEGWGMERDGIVTPVNPDDITKLTGQSQMTSNATFVARYIKNPSGHLTINHQVADGSVGDAETYVGVKAVKGADSEWLTGNKTEADHFTKDTFDISDPTYTSYKSGYTFQVWLKTEKSDFTNFDRFSAKSDISENYFSTEHQTSSGNVTTTYFEVNADDLFKLVDSFPVQQFDTLTYYSHLSAKEYSYNFNYTYPAYLSKYGNQGYRVTGTFTYDELNKYMALSSNNLTFKDTESKTSILNKLAPYEDNFKQSITWPTSTVTTSFSNNTISATIDAEYETSKTVQLTFKFNYQVDSNYKPVSNAEYSSEYITRDTGGAPYLSLYRKDSDFVTAPRELTDNSGNEWVFRYWSVTNVPDSKHSAEEYTRCYDDQFNFALFQDSIVTSVYTKKDTSEGARDGYDPDVVEANDAANNGIKISFIENSRNQYNDNQCGTGMTNSRKAMGDRMYTDFLMNYNAIAGNTVLKELGSGKKKAGLIIEVVGDVDMVDGKYTTKTEAEYREQYGSTIGEIGTKLSTDKETVDMSAKLTSFINGNTTALRGIKSEFDVTALDNKNRIQHTYSLLNRSHSDLNVISNNRYNVYRAYAYIGDVSGNTLTNIQISDKPTYFTIYDMASIQNYAEANGTGGIQ